MKRHLPHFSFVLLSSGVFFAFVPILGTASPVSLRPPAGVASARQSSSSKPIDTVPVVDKTVAGRQGAFSTSPAMGWNSYNCFGSAVTEKEVRENALYMAQNLKSHGWTYIVVDFLWSYPNPPESTQDNIPQFKLAGDGTYVPWLNMDSSGRLLPDLRKFPSARDGNGFKPLADYVHSLGLKFGIHVMRGIPRQAVWARAQVRGTTRTAADVADTTSTCEWLNHMFGVDMKKEGAQEYYNSLLNLYASWGVDFIKVDDLSRPYHAPEVEGYEKAIASCGRAIAFSTSPGNTPLSRARHVSTFANQWRMAQDFWDNWKELKAMFDLCDKWYPYSMKGHFPDCDMLTLGRLSKRGPVGKERMSRFTPDEQRTHMTLWCIFRSPLMMGGNLPENSAFLNELLTNDAALKMNQNGEDVKPVFHRDGEAAWSSHTAGAKGVNLALFNLNDEPREVTVRLSELGLKGSVRVNDVWQKKDMAPVSGSISRKLAPHACSLLILKS